jgi:hypothetical protein
MSWYIEAGNAGIGLCPWCLKRADGSWIVPTKHELGYRFDTIRQFGFTEVDVWVVNPLEEVQQALEPWLPYLAEFLAGDGGPLHDAPVIAAVNTDDAKAEQTSPHAPLINIWAPQKANEAPKPDFNVVRSPLKSDDSEGQPLEYDATPPSAVCEPLMRSAVGRGSTQQRQGFARCCNATRAQASCFSTAAAALVGSDEAGDAHDATLALQAALNCSTAELVIDSGRTWLSQPLLLTDGGPKRLLLEPGARLEALPGAFHGGTESTDSLLTIFETDGVTIEATGAVLHMHKEDYIQPSKYNFSEHRHALNILGAWNLTVIGMRANNSGGDGVYVTGSAHHTSCTRIASEGLTLRDVRSTRNYRQGLSVISAARFLATGCTFEDTGVGGFTSPAAGVDIEPGSSSNVLDDLRFVNCTARNNVGAGFTLATGRGGFMTRTNVTISFEDCTVDGGLSSAYVVSNGAKPGWPHGRVSFTRCKAARTAGAGIDFRDVASNIWTSFVNCSLENVAEGWRGSRGPHTGTGTWPWWNATEHRPQTAWPLQIDPCSRDLVPPVGQLTISGLKAVDSLPRPFLHAVAPRNTTAAHGGLLDIAIDATVQGWVNATTQCTPAGIESKAAWGVSVRVECSPDSRARPVKSDDYYGIDRAPNKPNKRGCPTGLKTDDVPTPCVPVVRPAPPRRAPPATGSQPHLVTLLIDDLGFDDLRSHDVGPNFTTFAPTVATLLREGVLLDRHHAYKWCSPTRRSFLTGRFPVSVTGEQAGAATNLTPLQFTLLSEKLQTAGYESHFVGKGHLGWQTTDHLLVNRGFASHAGYLGGGEAYKWGGGSVNASAGHHDMWHNELPGIDLVPEIYYSTNFYSEYAVARIKDRNQSRPFWLHVAYQAVHGGEFREDPPPQDNLPADTGFRNAGYGNALVSLDHGVENITQALRDSGMWSNTILVFLSDNGGDDPPTAGRSNAKFASNYPCAASHIGFLLARTVCFLHSGRISSLFGGCAFRLLGRKCLSWEGAIYTNV